MEAIYQDRVQFAQLVRDVATTDVCRMGIEILSFTIKDVYDDVDYLKSLGRTQTANVKRDAAIGVAQADRDAGIREAECEKEKTNVKYKSDTHVADAEREFKMKKAQYDKEINTQVSCINAKNLIQYVLSNFLNYNDFEALCADVE